MKLHQVLALTKGVQATAHQLITQVHHNLLKTQLLSGIVKTYEKKDDEGDDYPGEYQKVVLRVDRELGSLFASQSRLLDVTAARDYTNMRACADVVVDGEILVAQAPVPYLLWLEQQLKHYETLLRKLPTLDPGTDWTWNGAEGTYVSTPVRTVKTKKVEFPLVLHPGTDRHPPQVKVSTTDEVQGYWTTQKLSGAVKREDVDAALDRLRALQAAVRVAQSAANSVDAEQPSHGARVIDYVFGPLTRD